MPKPRVKTKCVANTYAGEGERIVEFGGRTHNEGGLIAFIYVEGKLRVQLYRLGADVEVTVAKTEERV